MSGSKIVKLILGFILLVGAVSCTEELLPGTVNSIEFRSTIHSEFDTKTDNAIFITDDGTIITTEEPDTKTAFSGQSGIVNGKERLNWVSGDRIKVWSNQAELIDKSSRPWRQYKPATGYSNIEYVVEPGSVNGSKHSGTLRAYNSNYSLVWGNDKTHDFVGVYPSTVSTTYSPEGSLQIHSNVSMSQSTTVNMKQAVMYASAVRVPRESTVYLGFKPLFNAYELRLYAEKNIAKKTLKKVTISSASSFLSGYADIAVSVTGYTVTPRTTARQQVYIQNLNINLSSDPENPTVFTLLALPTEQTELTIRLDFSDNTFRYLELKRGKNWYTTSPSKKVYITSYVGPKWVLESLKIERYGFVPDRTKYPQWYQQYCDNIVWSFEKQENVTYRVQGVVYNRDNPAEKRAATKKELECVYWKTSMGGEDTRWLRLARIGVYGTNGIVVVDGASEVWADYTCSGEYRITAYDPSNPTVCDHLDINVWDVTAEYYFATTNNPATASFRRLSNTDWTSLYLGEKGYITYRFTIYKRRIQSGASYGDAQPFGSTTFMESFKFNGWQPFVFPNPDKPAVEITSSDWSQPFLPVKVINVTDPKYFQYGMKYSIYENNNFTSSGGTRVLAKKP